MTGETPAVGPTPAPGFASPQMTSSNLSLLGLAGNCDYHLKMGLLFAFTITISSSVLLSLNL